MSQWNLQNAENELFVGLVTRHCLNTEEADILQEK